MAFKNLNKMKKHAYKLIGIGVGAVVGILVGFATFNIPIGLLFGIASGFMLGSFLDKKKF
jgi:uncharacterized membrane protein